MEKVSKREEEFMNLDLEVSGACNELKEDESIMYIRYFDGNCVSLCVQGPADMIMAGLLEFCNGVDGGFELLFHFVANYEEIKHANREKKVLIKRKKDAKEDAE
jgi:hypothetical protein